MLVLCLFAAAAAQETPAPVPTLVPPSQTLPEVTPVPVAARPLAVGDSGEDVQLFKLRMQYLGYFNQKTSLNAKLSETTLERVNQLLENNGMEPVDIITMEIQDMVFARDDLAIEPTPTPAPTPEPLIAPAGTPELPPLDADGFLPDQDVEFVFTDDADGLWYYISNTLFINIRRYNNLEDKNIWYETEIKTRGEQIQSILAKTIYTYRTPVDLARENRAVLAFTDDYFAVREYGVAIRDGEIYRDKIRTAASAYPPGDTLAVFADGTMRAYDYNAYTAQEYLAMGAVHVLTFGPWLISGGVINPKAISDSYMHYHEPRSAIGMIGPGHYVVLTVDGRYGGAKGVYLGWLALRMREIGVTEAINLDGGGTTALVFMGLQLSRVAAAKPSGAYTRKVTSMLGFGVSDTVPN